MTRKLSFLIVASAALALPSALAPAYAAPEGAAPALVAPQDIALIRVGDKLIRPHFPLPKDARPASVQAQTLSQTSTAITTHLTDHFVKATGSQSNLLTKQQAKASGWGWAADHFADIDKQNKGSVSLDDVLGYVRQTSNMALPHAAASQDIQIVH